MKTKIFFRIFSVVLLIVAAGCEKSSTPVIHQPLILPENSDQIIAAQNHFAFQLFKEVLQRDKSLSNKLVSPFSIYMALSMTYNGAANETQKAMQKALQLDGIMTGLLNETNKNLITGLPEEDSRVVLNIANSIWYRNEGYQPLPDFLQTIGNYYHAKVSGTDFDQATVNQINNWVANATHQKIKTILENISPEDVMYLINAIYFNGQWKYKFDANQTQDRTFHTANGEVQTSFMTQKATLNYTRNDSLQIIELPYGAGDFNMYILLPDEEIDLPQFVSSLNVNAFNHYLSELDSMQVKLYLPKWEYSYKIQNMKPELTAMGMGIVFNDADFSNMYPPAAGAYISKVIHKAYIEVNEKGTEAAAVTAVGISTTSSLPEPVIDVNHPFLYFITEKTSGTVLFIGEVNDPE